MNYTSSFIPRGNYHDVDILLAQRMLNTCQTSVNQTGTCTLRALELHELHIECFTARNDIDLGNYEGYKRFGAL